MWDTQVPWSRGHGQSDFFSLPFSLLAFLIVPREFSCTWQEDSRKYIYPIFREAKPLSQWYFKAYPLIYVHVGIWLWVIQMPNKHCSETAQWSHLRHYGLYLQMRKRIQRITKYTSQRNSINGLKSPHRTLAPSALLPNLQDGTYLCPWAHTCMRQPTSLSSPAFPKFGKHSVSPWGST